MAEISQEDLDEYLAGKHGVAGLDMARELVALRAAHNALKQESDRSISQSLSWQQGLEAALHELHDTKEFILGVMKNLGDKFGEKNE